MTSLMLRQLTSSVGSQKNPIFKVVLDNFSSPLKCSIHMSAPSQFRLDQTLNAEPMKAKKRIDPAVLMLRETRRKKKIEKEIKKLEKFGRRLKPIEENEPDRALLKEVNLRKRPDAKLTKDQNDEEYFLKKEWATYILNQRQTQLEQIKRALKSQEEALKELKRDSPQLYNAAIQLDAELVPYVREGPVHTMPVAQYEAPEGDFLDVTKLYDKR